jgi:hypothetical protein
MSLFRFAFTDSNASENGQIDFHGALGLISNLT